MNAAKTGSEQYYQNERMASEMEAYDEISLRDIFARLWRRRTAIVLWSTAILVAIVVIGGLIFLLQDRRQVAELSFRIDFDGIEKGEYPNGMKFSTSDILSTPVLNRVYDANDLKQYMTFSDFKGAVGVIQTNDDLRLLELEYEGKLSNNKLSVQDRERIEAEFRGKKAAIMMPVYALQFAKEGLSSIPSGVMAKVLIDILMTWAEYADRVKGALKYRISLVSHKALDKQGLDAEEYLVAIDMLRQTIERINGDIKTLAEVPGSETIKAEKTQLSLKDLKHQIEDILKFKVNPLSGLIRQAGIAKNEALASGYIKNRLFELKLEKEQALAKKNVYDDSLRQYMLKGGTQGKNVDVSAAPSLPLGDESTRGIPAMIPQFGGSFLESLIQLGQEHSDAEFRQKITHDAIASGIKKVEIEFQERYYNEVMSEMVSIEQTGGLPEFRKAAIEKVQTTFEDVYKQLMYSIDQLNFIYLALSKYNLEPASLLYTVLEPVTVQTYRAISPKRLFMFMVLGGFLAEAVLLFSILIATPSHSAREDEG